MTMPKCRNAEPGTYGHECGKPAVYAGKWEFKDILVKEPYFVSGFCEDCRNNGYERTGALEWQKINGLEVTFSDGMTWKWVSVNGDYYAFTAPLVF